MEYPNWRFTAGHRGSPSALPAYAVTANSTTDVIAALVFASRFHIRLSIKSSGHSYTGTSTAKDSLLLYTHGMSHIKWDDQFDDGCGSAAEPAVTVEPGVSYGSLYKIADDRGYILTGGGSSTVSAAGGYVLGGGHSVLSRSLGLAADNVLRIQIVLPNATVVQTTRCNHRDLFWALRGVPSLYYYVVTSILLPPDRFWALHREVGGEAPLG